MENTDVRWRYLDHFHNAGGVLVRLFYGEAVGLGILSAITNILL